MAQTHDIDGTTVSYISQAIWQQPTNSLSLNLIQVHNRWRKHTWLSDIMTVGEWTTLIGKRGSIVTITTTDPDDPNNANYVTYYGVIVQNVTHQAHDSRNIRGGKVEFLVKV